ncbi:uncharacterized protein LOC134286766 [Aedes albopictus]|uniref:Peptidase aspartic putative domain-containing protein n=1 Tax=Aedes albopictus TaxID=7160 RepID=A0ABM1ZCD0_AEDAL
MTLRKLTKAERGYLDSLVNVESFVANFDPQRDRTRIASRLEYLETLFKEFRENRAKVEARQEQDLAASSSGEAEKDAQVKKDMNTANRKTRLDFENRYFDVKDFLVSQRSNTTAAASSSSSPPGQTPYSRVNLPVFKIPPFDGSVKDWLSFRDAFQNTIGKDVSLSSLDKFNYLLSVLTKEARTLVESIEVTATNFDVAWQMLEQRFENKKMISRALMNSFLESEPIKRESYDALVNLIDSYERNLLQLRKIGLPTKGWSHLLAHILYTRLDAETQRHWERAHNSREAPTYEDMLTFLRDHLATLQPLALAKPRPSESRQDHGRPAQKPKVGSTLNHSRQPPIAPALENSSASQSQVLATAPATTALVEPSTSGRPSVALSASAPTNRNIVLLSTAVVKIEDPKGNVQFARALLDCCSERNLLSEHLAQKLELRRQHDPLALQGIGPSTATSRQSTMATIRSRCTDYAIDLKFHILPEFKPILPSNRLHTDHWNVPSFVQLADPRFFEPNRIDIILGAEVYYRLLLKGFVDLGPELPHLKETVFGWIVSGKYDATETNHSAVALVCTNADLEKQLARFWEVESCHSNETLSVEERSCETHFAATTTRDPSGRFVVSLPKKLDVLEKLGESRSIAIRRFMSLERRLQSNPQLLGDYEAFIQEYLQLGHMELIDPSNEVLPPGEKTYYMPHHCIVRSDSATTKLRVVFDASCATDSGVSLNDALMVGPVVQDELFSILLRFRMSRFVIVADLQKMYRQVLVHPSDRQLQRIVFRSSPSEPIRT